MSDQSQPYAHRRPPTGIPDSFSRLINSFDRRLHTLEQKRPRAQTGTCCYAVLIAFNDEEGTLYQDWRDASEGLVPPELMFVGG